MIFCTKELLKKYNNYVNAANKISRLVKERKLFLLTKGLYEDNPNAEGLNLASYIYGPSYISFNTALSYYGAIPENVYSFTSATCNKLKKKTYTNSFGFYTYRDVPAEVFSYGIEIKESNGYVLRLAKLEKALCDKLYEMPVMNSQRELEYTLFNEMRFDEDIFNSLNREDIYFIAPKYHSKNLYLLEKYLRRINHE